MIFYVMFLIVTFILMIFSKDYNLFESLFVASQETNLDQGKKLDIYQKTAVIIAYLLSALRYDVGWDFMAYYETIVFSRETNIVLNNEYINIFLIDLSRNLNIPQLYFIITSLISIGLIVVIIRNYSTDFWLSFILFITFPLFYLNSMSVIRNFAAISIALYGFRFIEERNFIRYVIIIAIASLFHKSAIIAIVFYPLSRVKLGRRMSVLLISSTLFADVLFVKLVEIFAPKYIVYNLPNPSQAGTKAIYVLFFILLLCLVYMSKLDKKNSNFGSYYNIYLFGVLVYLTFIKMGTLGHRLSLYGTIYSILLIPEVLSISRNRKTRFINRVLFYLLAISMFVYTIYVGRETYIPYELFFSN